MRKQIYNLERAKVVLTVSHLSQVRQKSSFGNPFLQSWEVLLHVCLSSRLLCEYLLFLQRSRTTRGSWFLLNHMGLGVKFRSPISSVSVFTHATNLPAPSPFGRLSM